MLRGTGPRGEAKQNDSERGERTEWTDRKGKKRLTTRRQRRIRKDEENEAAWEELDCSFLTVRADDEEVRVTHGKTGESEGESWAGSNCAGLGKKR